MRGVRLALVANPKSGAGEDADDLAERLRRHGHEVDVFTAGSQDEALASGPDRVVVAGGDGSIGPVFAAAAESEIPMAVLPVGTANDFARALELPEDLDEAIALAAGAAPGRVRALHGGCVDGVPFVNVASAGLAATAARAAERFKPVLGPGAYVVGAVRAGLRSDPVRATVVVDGEEVASGRVWQLIVGATGSFGGGSGLAEADPEDPRLTVAWIPGGSRLGLPRRALGMRSRRLEKQATVRWWQAHELRVEAIDHGRPARWNVDGEVRTLPVPAVFTRIGPTRVVVPA